MLAILQECQQETAAALQRFMSFLDKGKETTRAHSATLAVTTATARGTTPAMTAPGPAAAAGHTQGGWIPAKHFLDKLRHLLLGRRETARHPAMKATDTYDGTHSKLRSWWELVKDFMKIHKPTRPIESIQIKFVGFLLRDEARRWYDTRYHGVTGVRVDKG